MIQWNIEAALSAELITDVYVSTEDAEIADVARSCGARVIARPEELAGDSTSSEAVLQHAVEHLGSHGLEPEAFVFTQCTSPLTSPADLDGMIRKMLETEADSVVAVTNAVPAFLWAEDENGIAVPVNHDPSHRKMRQEFPTEYAEMGAAYVIRTAPFGKERTRFCGKTVLFAMPIERSIDINHQDDLPLAEALLRQRQSS